MARQIINVGTSANDGTGDTLRASQQKANSNFQELYEAGGANITVNNPVTNTETTLDDALADLETGGGGVPTLDEVLGEGGRLVRFTPNDGADAVFVLDDRQKVVLKRGSGDFFLNSGIFSVGDELIFEAILDGWGGGVSFGTDPIFVNGVDVSNSSVGIYSNQRGYLFLSEIVSGVEYWIYRVIGDIIQDNVFMLRSNNGSDIPNIATFRVNLGVDKITNRGDANYTILSTDKAVATNANFTAPRTFTLPLANSVNAGYEIIVADLFGGVSSTNTLIISRSGSDTINGANTVVIGAQYGMRRLFSDGVSKWTFDGGVMRISDYIGTTLTPSVIVATDANSKLQPLPTSTYPSLAELAYVKGVRSSLQTQIDALRLPIAIDTGNRTHTGTVVETVVASLQIPANTLDAVCNLFMSLDYGKNTGQGVPIRLYRNTTNSISGATQIALYNTGSNRNGGFLRKMLVRGTSLDLLSSATTSLISNMNVDLLFTATDTQTIAPSGNIWILVTVALDATGTVFTIKSFAIEKQKLG